MPFLFALTLFVSALLLFLVEPMVGKLILPLLGGTPAVWNTCMVFFQALLLLGYLYAHWLTTRYDPKKQIAVHMALLIAAGTAIAAGAIFSSDHSPIPIVKSLSPQGDEYPFFGVLALLTVALGVPFFVLCTSAPLLQKWFAETGHPSAKDPYFLYGASNFGSLLALVAYPAIVEPELRLLEQAWLWAAGYAILIGMIVYCARALKHSPTQTSTKMVSHNVSTEPPPSWLTRFRWLALAFVPSSLMLGVTTSFSTDIASIPLLWLIPLALYLITFIIVFSRVPEQVHLLMTLLMPVLILLIAFVMTSHVPAKFSMQLALHMGTFFVVCMVCHGELARTRPTPRYLTNFYLIMSLGGMFGGMFNALVAPIVFNFISEYPLTLVAACFLLPSMVKNREGSSWDYYLDATAALGIFFLCRTAQTYQYELREFMYAHGRSILAGALVMILPAAAFIVMALQMQRSTMFIIILAAMLCVAGVGYGSMWLLVDHLQEGSLMSSALQHAAGGSFADATLGQSMLRFVPALFVGVAYAFYWFRKSKPEEVSQNIGLGLAALVVCLGAVTFLTGEFRSLLSPWTRSTEDLDILRAKETLRQIMIFGIPAMICYFFVERPLRFGLAVAAMWLAAFVTEQRRDTGMDPLSFTGKSGLLAQALDRHDEPPGSSELYYTRTFFGRMKIQPVSGYYTQLIHGTTVHGMQDRRSDAKAIIRTLMAPMRGGDAYGVAASYWIATQTPDWQFPGRVPLTYYHRTGPIGSMFEVFYDRVKTDPTANADVACIGLGTGSLASYGMNSYLMRLYGRDNQQHRMTFFEIDPTVRRLVEPPKYFTYIDQARKQGVNIDFEMGDARITLERTNRKFGMMLIDAFSSDAIPAHLLTKQAVQLYFERLEEDGLLCIHISNRYMNLEPVVDRIARELRVEARVMHGSSDEDAGKSGATWIALARKPEYLGRIEQATEKWRAKGDKGYVRDQWMELEHDPKLSLWTDDYYSVPSVLVGEWRFWSRD